MTHPVLVPVEQALHGLAGVDLGVMPAAELSAVVVGLRRLITGFEAEFARFAHAAEFAEVWRTGGATSIQAWLAAATGATIKTARRQVRLADTVTKAPVIGDRMRAGQLSADNAEALKPPRRLSTATTSPATPKNCSRSRPHRRRTRPAKHSNCGARSPTPRTKQSGTHRPAPDVTSASPTGTTGRPTSMGRSPTKTPPTSKPPSTISPVKHSMTPRGVAIRSGSPTR